MQRFSMRFSTPTTVSLSFILSSAFACYHSPWFSELTLCMPPLRIPHHATLCSSCLNCQSNFRLKVFLLFLTPTAVSFFVYSFFCFSHSSVLPDFLNWLFTLPPLRMPPHVTLCSSICVSASVVLQSCSSTRVPAVVFQHLWLSQHLCSHLCCSVCVRILCCSICVLFCVAASVFAFVLQRLCFSFCVPASVLHTQSIAINDNLDHLRHLCCSHISNTFCSPHQPIITKKLPRILC